MSALPQPPDGMSIAEYLAMERASEIKHEFIDGQVLAMSGASYNHNMICGMLVTILNNQLSDRDCAALPSDMKVHVPATGSFAYPDVSVICGTPDFHDEQKDVVMNPVLLIEVLSPSTEAYDRGKKFELYRALPSVMEYVLVAQDRPYIERYLRQESGLWQFETVNGLDATLKLPALNCVLSLSDVYKRVIFE